MNASSAHSHASRPAAPERSVLSEDGHSSASGAVKPRPVRGFVQPAERTRTGRPTLQTPEIVECICAQIRTHGISDSSAGLLAGISTSTLSRWKLEDEHFATLLGQARAQYDVARLSAIRGAQKRDGSVDWRAQAWLLQNSSPGEFGQPSRRSKYRRRVSTEPMVEIQASDVTIITEAELELIQAARARAGAREPAAAAETASDGATAALSRATGESLPKIPETPAARSAPSTGGEMSPEARILPILPETRHPLTGPVRPSGVQLRAAREEEYEAKVVNSSRNSAFHAAA